MAKYGVSAYPGKFPIGPSSEYESPLGISESKAHYHPENAQDLVKALGEPSGTGRLIWIARGVRILLPGATFGKAIKSGWILAGPGEIKWDYYGPTSGYMVPLFNLQAGGAISGVKLTGGGGFGHYGQSCGPCAIRASGQARTLVENVDLTQFRGGGVWFGDAAAGITRWDDDAQRNILRHVRISHIQQYGFGYGCGLQGSRQSFLIEASILEDCRHLTMSSGGTTTAYELRYCILGNAVYANRDEGPATIQSHQVDVHGGGWDNQSYRCGAHLWVHHCEFSANNAFSEKPNVCIRGRMADGGEAVIENCWTRKRHGKDPAGAYTDLETAGNGRIVMLAEAEGQAWEGPAALSSAGVIARNNWYGPEAPPADDAPADTGTVPQIYSADIRVAQLEAPLAILGQPEV